MIFCNTRGFSVLFNKETRFYNNLAIAFWRSASLWQPFRNWRGEKMYAVLFFVRDIKVRYFMWVFCRFIADSPIGKFGGVPNEVRVRGNAGDVKNSHKRLNVRVFPVLFSFISSVVCMHQWNFRYFAMAKLRNVFPLNIGLASFVFLVYWKLFPIYFFFWECRI